MGSYSSLLLEAFDGDVHAHFGFVLYGEMDKTMVSKSETKMSPPSPFLRCFGRTTVARHYNSWQR